MRLPAQDAILRSLLELQSNAMHHYFRLRSMLEALEARTKAASRSVGLILSEAIEMERTRIARELHSGVGQTLAGIKVNLELLEARTPDGSGRLYERGPAHSLARGSGSQRDSRYFAASLSSRLGAPRVGASSKSSGKLRGFRINSMLNLKSIEWNPACRTRFVPRFIARRRKASQTCCGTRGPQK